MESNESPLSHDDVFPANFAEVVASLPRGPPYWNFPSLCLYRGFWFLEQALLDLPRVHASLNECPGPADILLASFPKSGTTWLKALAFATARRSVHSPLDHGHPLLSSSSHECVRFLGDGGDDDTTVPRLLGTHLPYSLLPRRATEDGGGCRIVYIARDPKDTLVSAWYFGAGVRTEEEEEEEEQGGGSAGEGARPQTVAAQPALKFEEVFELFCQGYCAAGPQWEHVREYWEAGKRRPGSMLFLRYEEMLQDPAGNLKKLAEFMGCPFSAAEDDSGVVRSILDLCSLDKQQSLPVNKTGAFISKFDDTVITIDNKHFFRKGITGDWRNHMTLEMAARLDGIVEEALQGSGFTFGYTNTNN